MTTNAPVGPPMQTLVPPSEEMRKPAMTAVKIPACGGAPDAMAKAIANGSATMPTVRPAMRSALKSWPEYSLRVSSSLGRKGLAIFISKVWRRLRLLVLSVHDRLGWLAHRAAPQGNLLK